MYPAYPPPFMPPLTPEEELAMLEDYKQGLEGELEGIKAEIEEITKRIEELRKQIEERKA